MKEEISIFYTPENRIEEYKALRLESLKNDPEAFGSSYDRAVNSDEAYWSVRALNSLVAECNGKFVGTCSFYSDEKYRKMRHIAHFVGMYVSPNYRGKGVATKLMKRQIDIIKAKNQFTKIRLGVGANQTAARALYEKMGFEYVGLFKNELFVNGVYLDEYYMELYL